MSATRTLVLLTFSVALVGSNSLALSPMAVSVADTFAPARPADVMLASALFGSGTAASALFFAAFLDRIGLSRALVLALTLLSVSLAVSGLAPSLVWLQVAQVGAGIGSGVALPAIYGLAAEEAPPGAASRYLGRVLTGWTLSMVFGASLAALIADFASWRAVYGLLSASGLATVAALLAAGHFARPGRAGHSTSPLAALGVPGIGPALMVCGAYMMAFYGLYAYVGTHLQAGLGVPTWLAGAAPLAYGIGFGGAAFADPLIDRHGPARVAWIVFLLLALFYLVLAALSGLAYAVIGLCLVWGMVNHVALNLIISRLSGLDPARRGAILGLNSGVTYIAMFAGTALYGRIYTHAGFMPIALLSAACILPALADAALQRRKL